MTGMSQDIKPPDSSGVEVNTINLKVLEAQIKASGDESLETKEMLGCMHKFDKNKNGTMEAMELMAMVKDNVEVHRSKTRLTVWLKVSGVMIFVLTLIMSGLVVGVVAAFKDAYVKGDSTMSDGNGHVLKVTSAEIALPLFVAPVLGGARLAAIEKVRIMTSDCDSSKFGKAGQPIPPPSSKVGGVELPGSPPSPPPCVEGESGTGCDMIPEDEVDQTDCDETETEHFLKVETVRRYNDTALVFLMANNQSLYVWNGETVYVDAEGTSFSVCEATATCAALYVDDNDEKEQLEEKAYAALEAGGFTEAAGHHGRQLHTDVRRHAHGKCKRRPGKGEGNVAGKTSKFRMTSVLTSTNDEELLRCLKSSSFMDCIERFD